MRLERVCDLELERSGDEYDLVIFASGYETRATQVARRVEPARCRDVLLCGFHERADDPVRKRNDEFFRVTWKVEPTLARASDDSTLFSEMQRRLAWGERARVLVDYSSMSRLWYAAVLNWARVAQMSEVTLDFVYAVGIHRRDVPPMVIDEVSCVPGFEGGAATGDRSVAVFGLGFEGPATLCVRDRLESDVLIAYWADPGAFASYARRAKKANVELLEMVRHGIGLPLRSVETTFRNLAEVVSQFRGDSVITMVPMGPKPHVLAALLLGLRFEELSCLRVSGVRHESDDVSTNGVLVCTRVVLRNGKAA